MSGKDIIPVSLPQEAELTDAEKQEFSRKRDTLISELRCITGLPDVASNLNQEAVYKLVLAPEGAELYKDAQGNLNPGNSPDRSISPTTDPSKLIPAA